jgi:ribonuclease BN (tRNA processing enzyme)
VSLRFEVLGFAGAAPLEGACSSYVVSGRDRAVLLDCGPGTVERLWRRGLLQRLDAVVTSHTHADHVLDLLPFAGEVVRSLLDGRRIALHVPHNGGPEMLRGLDSVFARGRRHTTTRFDAAVRRAAQSFSGPIDLAREGWVYTSDGASPAQRP